MNEILYLILAFITGLFTGGVFFGGLWFTIKKAVKSKNPALWFLGSFLVRTGITLTGFYFISLGNWQRLLVCLAAFILVRFVILHITGSKEERQILLKKEVTHEA